VARWSCRPLDASSDKAGGRQVAGGDNVQQGKATTTKRDSEPSLGDLGWPPSVCPAVSGPGRLQRQIRRPSTAPSNSKAAKPTASATPPTNADACATPPPAPSDDHPPSPTNDHTPPPTDNMIPVNFEEPQKDHRHAMGRPHALTRRAHRPAIRIRCVSSNPHPTPRNQRHQVRNPPGVHPNG